MYANMTRTPQSEGSWLWCSRYLVVPVTFILCKILMSAMLSHVDGRGLLLPGQGLGKSGPSAVMLSQEHNVSVSENVHSPWGFLSRESPEKKSFYASLGKDESNNTESDSELVRPEKTSQQASDVVQNKIPAALVYLLRGSLLKFSYSIWLLFLNFNNVYKYPVYIFHEPDFDVENCKSIIRNVLRYSGNTNSWNESGYDSTTGNHSTRVTDGELEQKLRLIEFHQIEFKMPPSLANYSKDEIDAVRDWRIRRFPMGYSHMINFFFADVFQHEAVRDLQYYWRVDSDAYYMSKINYDVFEKMRSGGYKYGTFHISADPDWVTKGIKDWVEKYIKEQGLTMQLTLQNNLQYRLKRDIPLGMWPWNNSQPMYYNNFEVCHVPTYRTQPFVELSNSVKATDSIFLRRWGDAPLRFAQNSLLLDFQKDIIQISDIGYCHQSFKRFVPGGIPRNPCNANNPISGYPGYLGDSPSVIAEAELKKQKEIEKKKKKEEMKQKAAEEAAAEAEQAAIKAKEAAAAAAPATPEGAKAAHTQSLR